MINSIFNKTKMNILELQFNEDPNKSAEDYSRLVFSRIQSFDCAILGVGDDGHIASLFPNTQAINNVSFGFVANEVNILSKWRITSTFDLLETVEDIFLLVTGDNKNSILQEIGKNDSLPVNELISEGNLGLMQAVKKFDPDKGFRLATYAMWWIKASIQEYVLKSWSLVKMGTTAAQKKLFFNLKKIKNQISPESEGDLRPEHVNEIANKLDAVSYTHLRAHETREDLVFRVLV